MKLRSIIQKIGADVRSLRGDKNQLTAPPVLTEPVRFPYGPFRWKMQLPKDREFSVLACTDLRNWMPVLQGKAKEGLQEYIDSEAFKFPYRLYRLLTGGVYSSNVIGYASVSLPPGFSMIANPFDSHESVADTFKNWPDGTSLNKFDTRQFRLLENAVKDGKWADAHEKILRSEGAIFFNPTSDYKNASFVGEVCQGNLSVPIPSGFSLRGALLPKAGNLVEELGFPIADGDVIHLFDREQQKYLLYPYVDGKWTSGQPILGVGEAFWVAKTEPKNWAQDVVIEN